MDEFEKEAEEADGAYDALVKNMAVGRKHAREHQKTAETSEEEGEEARQRLKLKVHGVTSILPAM